MEREVILISFWPSMFGMRLKVALAEKAIPYDYREENFPGKSQLLLRLNPIHKKVPVLVHNGKPVNESLIALQYIDEVWKETGPAIMPSDPYLRSQASFWADFIDKKIHSLGAKVWKLEGEAKEVAKKDFIRSLKLLVGVLGDEPFFGGKTFGFLDMVFIGYSCWFSTYETYGSFSIMSECPQLISWVERCWKRESVAKSLPKPLEVLNFAKMVTKVYGFDRGFGRAVHS